MSHDFIHLWGYAHTALILLAFGALALACLLKVGGRPGMLGAAGFALFALSPLINAALLLVANAVDLEWTVSYVLSSVFLVLVNVVGGVLLVAGLLARRT